MLILADLKLEREQSKRIYTNISNTVVENRVFLVFECFMRAPPMRSFSKNRKRTKIMKKSLEFSKLFFQTRKNLRSLSGILLPKGGENKNT